MRIQRHLVEALRANLRAGGVPRLPAGGDLCWKWFIDLNRTRTWHAAGPNAISYCEIEAYCRVRRWPLEQRHIEVLTAMDEAYLEHFRQAHARVQAGGKPQQRHTGQAITPDLLDALFA
ncbi:phage tail assembly chaperone [Rhizobium herbae]|uniref:Uncharacterized protein n=1 Tax=Rhizobium herbae TaxID=508661 RepID=A0ABS4EFZ2_9HYPH|nr:hypothetical protein [Rhizobium herbae]MBP1856864.1 hypothetical protein [Rhizobium herbae]